MTTTLQQLSDRWNLLRNTTLGRGNTLPKGVSPQLAETVGEAYEHFRAWLIGWQGPLAEVTSEAVLTGEAAEWADHYVELAAEVSRATGKPLPGRPVPTAQQAIHDVASAVLPTAVLVAGGLVVVALAVSSLRGRR